MSEQKFIYHMYRLSNIVPPKREILKNISLSLFPGGKIGVVGPNGSGKSSLLKIMAGLDPDFLTGAVERFPWRLCSESAGRVGRSVGHALGVASEAVPSEHGTAPVPRLSSPSSSPLSFFGRP